MDKQVQLSKRNMNFTSDEVFKKKHHSINKPTKISYNSDKPVAVKMGPRLFVA